MIELQKEINLNHKELAIQLNEPMEFEEWIARICTYLGIIVDGFYDHDEVIRLLDVLIEKLKEKRMIIIF